MIVMVYGTDPVGCGPRLPYVVPPLPTFGGTRLDATCCDVQAAGTSVASSALLAAGMSVRQINPFKLRQFAKACGVAKSAKPTESFRGVLVRCPP